MHTLNAPITGKLQSVKLRSNYLPQQPPASWYLSLELGPDRTEDVCTKSRMALTLLNTAVLKADKWDVEINTQGDNKTISRVRILDDRDCKPGLKRPDGLLVRPFTPTAFVDEVPVKWGFFFVAGTDCGEWKGTSFDVYRVVEFAWMQQIYVILTFDSADHIIAANLQIGD